MQSTTLDVVLTSETAIRMVWFFVKRGVVYWKTNLGAIAVVADSSPPPLYRESTLTLSASSRRITKFNLTLPLQQLLVREIVGEGEN